jgi:hypothetical protein
MALSNHISDLITAYKAMPNGERRNKIISHLKDAEAHGKLLELEDPRLKSAADEASLFASGEGGGVAPSTSCICKPGLRRSSCMAEVHVA